MCAELQERLLSSKDPSSAIFDETEAFYDIIEKLHDTISLPSDVMLPLTALAQNCGYTFSRITQSILDILVQHLSKCMDEHKEIIPQILESIAKYIHRTNFHSLFEKIVVEMPSLPDYFLLELLELPLNLILTIFQQEESRTVIFTQCRPIFHRIVLRTINDFITDPLKLDFFLNSIRTRIQRKQCIEDEIVPREFEFFINLQGERLSDKHSEICKDAKNKLLEFCCRQQVLYQDVCCILRDIWEKTDNALLPALRLELAATILDWRTDPAHDLALAIFDFFDDQSFSNSKVYPTINSTEAKFISSDPCFIFLLYCIFLKNLITRITKETYIPFDERGECKLLLRLIDPTSKVSNLEDFANYLESFYITLDLYDPEDELVQTLKSNLAKTIHKSQKLSNLLIFCGQQLIERRQDQTLMEIGLSYAIKNSNNQNNGTNDGMNDSSGSNVEPDLILAHVMLTHLNDTGFIENLVPSNDIYNDGLNVCIDKRLEILFIWSLNNNNILLYFLALLLRRTQIIEKNADRREESPVKELQTVRYWLENIREEIKKGVIRLEPVARSILQALITSVNNAERIFDGPE
ncbi:hypothetical protein TRFO_23837 [Tritrichomonas foetus]|uniref:Uncharacterized protein n=1 Tax=Tritrichomonas foetus TaxID=1144522 RepID=A0A1J4KEC0_9EUKA|nr:hypothetical protein TRFO_23837 [Tritrichomonas foetus]|eukprot:OHT07805.1 hypothetical protein TRFO_23837 [Tritrichomonas foetus]